MKQDIQSPAETKKTVVMAFSATLILFVAAIIISLTGFYLPFAAFLAIMSAIMLYFGLFALQLYREESTATIPNN